MSEKRDLTQILIHEALIARINNNQLLIYYETEIKLIQQTDFLRAD